jgi:hypothetical protein
MEAKMRMFTGYEPGRAARRAGSIAFSVCALALLPLAAPAAAADFEYRYGDRYEYYVPAQPRPRYGEYYEQRVAPPPAHYGEPREYRVVVYPVKRDYGERHGYPPPAHPPRRYSDYYEEYEYEVPAAAPRVYSPRPVYREARVYRPYPDAGYEPYGRALEAEPLLPPAPVGPPRW